MAQGIPATHKGDLDWVSSFGTVLVVASISVHRSSVSQTNKKQFKSIQLSCNFLKAVDMWFVQLKITAQFGCFLNFLHPLFATITS